MDINERGSLEKNSSFRLKIICRIRNLSDDKWIFTKHISRTNHACCYRNNSFHFLHCFLYIFQKGNVAIRYMNHCHQIYGIPNWKIKVHKHFYLLLLYSMNFDTKKFYPFFFPKKYHLPNRKVVFSCYFILFSSDSCLIERTAKVSNISC